MQLPHSNQGRFFWAFGILVVIWIGHFLSPTNRPIAIDNALSSILKPSTLPPIDANLAVRELCQKTQWREGLWLTCHSSCGPDKVSMCGGLNNARNRIQACVRLGIALGAGVMLPRVTARYEEDLSHTDGVTTCPSEWWDIDALQDNMRKMCPQLAFKICEEKLDGGHVVDLPYRLWHEWPYVNHTFWQMVDDSMNQAGVPLDQVHKGNSALLRFGDSHISWTYRDAGELATTRKALFQALVYNQTLINLGNNILRNEILQGGRFIGVHLRAEYDWPSSWGSRETQLRVHMAEIEQINAQRKNPIKVIYVSCGDRGAIQQFRDMLRPMNYTVHSKWTVLANDTERLDQIENLRFDSKGVVEYSVLVGAEIFLGLVTSSFSALIAYARTIEDRVDYYETYIHPQSTRWALERKYAENMAIKGNEHTKLLVADGQDIMDAFP